MEKSLQSIDMVHGLWPVGSGKCASCVLLLLCISMLLLQLFEPSTSRQEQAEGITFFYSYSKQDSSWTATEVTPTLTGLPPRITILAKFERLMVEMQTTKDAILGGVVTELDWRRIGSQSQYDKEEIILATTNMHREVLKKVGECICTLTAVLRDVVPCSDARDETKIFVTERPLVSQIELAGFNSFF